jgi:hypothetical protein
MLGGERSVIELLENESRGQLGITLMERRNGNQAVQSRSFTSFFFRPYAIGRDLLTIERFGLVQYVSYRPFCLYDPIMTTLFGV